MYEMDRTQLCRDVAQLLESIGRLPQTIPSNIVVEKRMIRDDILSQHIMLNISSYVQEARELTDKLCKAVERVNDNE